MLLAADQSPNPWPPTIAAILVGGLAFLGAAIGIAQKWRHDRREAWWDRTQWALSQLSGTDEARTVALVVLSALVGSRLATAEDAAMLEQVGFAILEEPR